jgi:type III secretion protein C
MSQLRSLMPKMFGALIVVLALGFTARGAQAGPPPWPDAPYTYYADGKPLEAVLREFASGFSLSTDLPNGLTQVVNGRFNLRNPSEFIDRITGTYGLTWFTHAGTLFVSRSHEILVRSIPTANASGTGASGLRRMLTDLQVLDARFGWGELPDQGVVVVSGPPAYVRLVETTIASLPTTPGGLQVAVFRLKHASVDDRTISYRDREITTPGVANILRSLVAGTMASGSAGAASILSRPPLPGFSATAPVDGRGSAGDAAPRSPQTGSQVAAGLGSSPESSSSSASAQGGAGPSSNGNLGALPRVRPSIQSDPRINAIIVQDTPERIPVYERLIAQLDVPTPLIEIEALIIDVNSSRLDELGVTWNAMGRNQGTVLGYGTVNNALERGTLGLSTGPRGAGFASPSTILANSAEYFVARLRLLEQQGDASIQARPSILTTENIGAVIDLSETFYIQTTSERTALVTPVTAGTTLRVTPRLIAHNGRQSVRLNVDIEDGQIQQTQAGGLPTVRRGTVSTEASVQEFESLLIGGYNSIQTVKGVEKVPGLGDIPILGALFSSNSQQVQRRERLFLIRPTVIATNSSSGGLAQAPKSGAAASSQLATDAAAKPEERSTATQSGADALAASPGRRAPPSTELAQTGSSSAVLPRPDVKALEAQAVAGDTQARLRLAETYDTVLQQPERALPWYRQAAERGEASAQRRLGEMLYEAHGVARDLPQAIQWFERAAAQGDAQAQYWLGYASMRGEGLPRDLAAARRFLTDSARQGHQPSLRALEALAPRGSASDWYSLGRLLERRTRDSERALPWYSRAAAQGNPEAMARLGELSYDGTGTARDLDRARSFFQQAADKGSSVGEFRLAGMIEAGLGSRADEAEALRLYRSAADKGQIDAMIRLAMAYERGELGLTRDEAQANRWREAARRAAQTVR